MVTLYFMVLRRTSIVRIIRGLVPAADGGDNSLTACEARRADLIANQFNNRVIEIDPRTTKLYGSSERDPV